MTPLTAAPWNPSVGLRDGEVAIGTIVVNDKTNKGLANGASDLGKFKGAYRYAVRLDYIQDEISDDQLDFYDALVINGSTPFYENGDKVIVENVKGRLMIRPGCIAITSDSNSRISRTVPLSKQGGAGISTGSANHIPQAATRDKGTLQDRNKGETTTSIVGACSDKTEYDGMQTALKNFLATYKNIREYTTTYLAATTKIVGDLEGELKRTASIIGGFMQMLFQRIRAYVIEKIKKGIDRVKNNLHPPNKRAVNSATTRAIDTISCLFDNILNRALPIITDFLKDIVDRFVNVPMCAVESAIGSLTGQVSGQIGSGIDSALEPVKSALGSISSVVGQIFEVGDFVTTVLGFFTCDSGKPLCPGVKEWGWISGPNPKDTANFSNIVTNFNLSGGTSRLLGNMTSAGLGTAPGSLGYALGFGTGPAPTASPCNIGPAACGPPSVSFFGGGGSGTTGNVIVSTTGSILGIDITSAGSRYSSPPFIQFVDACGSGSGASAEAYLNAATGLVDFVTMKSSGAGYRSSSSSSSSGGGGSTLVPSGSSAVSIPSVPATTPSTATGSGVSASVSGYKLTVSPSKIVEGPGTPLIIDLVPPSTDVAGKKYHYVLRSTSGSKESSIAKFLGKPLEFPEVKIVSGIPTIESVKVFTESDLIFEPLEKVTVEIVEVPGLTVVAEVENESVSSYSSTAPGYGDYAYTLSSLSISVTEGETAKIKLKRSGINLDVETKVDYIIENDELRYGSSDPRVAKEGTHFLYPKIGGGTASKTGTITFGKKQTEIEIPIITLSSAGLFVPGIDSREIRFELVKNSSSTTVDDIFTTRSCVINIKERKPVDKDAGVPAYQAPLITRVKALEVTGLFDPAVGRVVEFRNAGTYPGEIFIGSLPEVKLFLAELKALTLPYSIEAVENVERLQALALDAVINKYEESVKGGVVVKGVVASLEFVTDVWEFYDFFKDTGTAALRNEYVTKDGRKGFVLEDKYTQSAYKTTKENIPIFWQLKNLINDDIDYYAITMRSSEAKYAGNPTIYWDVKYINPDAVKSEIPAGSKRIKGDIPITVGNAIHTKLDTFPGYKTPVTSGSTVIGKTAPLPAGTDPAYSFVGYVAPELPSRIPGYSPADAAKTYKYEITVYAYIKPGLGGGMIYNTLEFFVEG